MKKLTTVLLMAREALAEYRRWQVRRSHAHRLKETRVNQAYVERQKDLNQEYQRAKEAAQARAQTKQPAAKAPQDRLWHPKTILELLRDTFNEWNADKAPQLAAALAYYTTFSLAPLLIIVIAVAGLVLGRDQVQTAVLTQMKALVGDQGASLINGLIQNVPTPGSGIVATIVGLVTLILGAAGVFGQLKAALNEIWDIPVHIEGGLRGILRTLKDHFLSFTMVLGIGFLLLVSLILSAALAAVGEFTSTYIPIPLWQTLYSFVSFGFVMVLFAAIFKVLPDAEIAWRDVWIGAAITSLLFTAGRFLIGLYLGQGGVTSAYGAAGSLVVILLWVFYSAQILFFGAEFTQVYANRFGSRVVAEDATSAPKPTAQTATT